MTKEKSFGNIFLAVCLIISAIFLGIASVFKIQTTIADKAKKMRVSSHDDGFGVKP